MIYYEHSGGLEYYYKALFLCLTIGKTNEKNKFLVVEPLKGREPPEPLRRGKTDEQKSELNMKHC